MFTFPSLEWFQELARLMNENDVPYRRLGYADVRWAVEIQPTEPDQTAHLFVFAFRGVWLQVGGGMRGLTPSRRLTLPCGPRSAPGRR